MVEFGLWNFKIDVMVIISSNCNKRR